MSGRGQKRPWYHVGSDVWFARKETSIDGRQGAIPVIAVVRVTGRYGILGRRARHSALILAVRITFAHFSVSSAMSFPNPAGVSGSGTPPRSSSRCFILGSARAVLISLLSFSTMSVGVLLGAPMPCHPLAS